MTNTLYKKHRLAFPKKRKFCVLFSSFFYTYLYKLILNSKKFVSMLPSFSKKLSKSYGTYKKLPVFWNLIFYLYLRLLLLLTITFVTYDTKTNFYFVRCFDLELDSGNYFLYFFHIFVCELASVVLCVCFADFLSM